MYNLEQLANKELSELQMIATELGVANADKLEKNDLMFRIIDEQADAAATSASTTEKAPKKRTRVSVKNVDRVYSASQNKTTKIDKKMQVTLNDTLFGSLSQEEKDMLTPVESQVQAPAQQEEVAKQTEETPKKRGRKKKEEQPETVEAEQKSTDASQGEPQEGTVAQQSEEAPKKRGRKKKEEQPETVEAHHPARHTCSRRIRRARSDGCIPCKTSEQHGG